MAEGVYLSRLGLRAEHGSNYCKVVNTESEDRSISTRERAALRPAACNEQLKREKCRIRAAERYTSGSESQNRARVTKSGSLIFKVFVQRGFLNIVL